tara:strand:- start:1892 stop:2821 length:930 start_codon:yes stop_codon:yes gene_type:complete
MKHYEKDIILKRFPPFELSYVKTIHNKVYSDIVLAIPFGKKYYAWFSYYKKDFVCFFLEIGRDNNISHISIFPVCFHEDLAKNTIFYGTFIENRFFFIENIYYYKNTNVSFYTFNKKLALIEYIFNHELKQTIFTPKDIYFGLPIIKNNFNDLISIIPYLNYKIYAIQFRNGTQVHNATNLVYKKNTTTKAFFEIRANLQNDIYDLYCLDSNDNKVFYSYAVIPDYTTSVMMNDIFRNIKENQNLDALEESDDEDEFENVNKDKFIFLNTVKIMECSFNTQHSKWFPVKTVHHKNISLKKDIIAMEKLL